MTVAVFGGVLRITLEGGFPSNDDLEGGECLV